ncbi:ATPase, AAA-type, core [Parasponia andersonii]|uniref:ATPase, AAA-type, core n=1 Tax=Parasponia andersonii TaxID=3476 RepID=A0A2P5ACT8_PARAD|nr:ATPase, AAA-type, core [Parasponia andersonii]
MRKRSGGGGGGGGGGSFSQSMRHILRRRMCSFEQLDSATANEIAEHLRSFYPDYHRIKLQSLTKIVEQTLASIRRLPPQTPPPAQTLSFDDDEEEEEEEEEADEGRKKPKKGGSEDSEERLQRLEEVRLREIRRNGRAGPSVESPSSEEEEEQSEDSDEADLTSEDAVYGEKVERRYDLTKSLLRVTYGESAKSKKEKKEEEEAAVAARRKKKKKKEKNVEMELPGPDKDGFTVVTRRKKSPPKNNEDKASSSGTLNVEATKRNRRPRFKDLGGMKEVLKELEMEVLVPFYHPQLPRWLGIRPISGILLHGPPGCGKTRLAHAIANETGVPFYKICATELVTGISGKISTAYLVFSSKDLTMRNC